MRTRSKRWVPSASPSVPQQAGVDGVLVVDYPPEEAQSWSTLLEATRHRHDLPAVADTTDERAWSRSALGRGYLYYVSLKGVTGAATSISQDVAQKIPQLRTHIKLPIGVGFGIRDAADRRAVAAIADAVVIGSRLVQEIETPRPTRCVANVAALVSGIRKAMDE